ncbi:MAG TPA: HAD family hydrolase [Acidimicrobiales bacterium]|nr:HAD family hydrolase [Acidimicrobiales bacterium]
MAADEHLLESWNDTATRQAIVGFVDTVTDSGGDGFVPPEERIAVTDNDGTLWAEKPMPIQLDFTLHRLARQAAEDPSLRGQQPWKASYEKDLAWLGQAMVKHYHGDDSDLRLLMGAIPKAFAALTVEQYSADVTDFFRTAQHPKLGRPYRDCGYRPMVELLRFLEANDFVTYIASGGDRDFMRPIAGDLYGIPPERVIGSSFALDYRESDDDRRDVLYKAEMEFFDDGPTKPVRIWSRIGRRPILAAGNSNGDIQMLRFARTPTRPALRLLVLHDDPEREFDYTAGAERSLEHAKAHGWTVVSIRDDWATVFDPTTAPGSR